MSGSEMIRPATHDDIPALVDIGREFVAMSPHRILGEFDPEAVARMFGFMIDNPATCVLLTNDCGLIGGIMTGVYFCPTEMMMEELFWFAHKGGRDLLKAFEKKAREMGADYIYLSTLENAKADVATRMAQGMGFQPIERRYMKVLQ